MNVYANEQQCSLDIAKEYTVTKSKSEQLYDEHHVEFEAWFTTTHPNHTLTFEWEHVWDSGWYKEDMANGAWITWLDLTGKNTAARAADTVESLAQETLRLNEAQLALTKRANGVLIPLADQLIKDGKLDELKSLVAAFPACPARMNLAGKIAQVENL